MVHPGAVRKAAAGKMGPHHRDGGVARESFDFGARFGVVAGEAGPFEKDDGMAASEAGHDLLGSLPDAAPREVAMDDDGKVIRFRGGVF